MSWFRIDGSTIFLSVHAQPGAKRTEVQGIYGDALKIRLAARPVEGAANTELIRFLADVFTVLQRDISLTHCETSRRKQFVISGGGIEPLSLLP